MTVSINGFLKVFLDVSEMSTLCVMQRASVTAMDPFSFTKKSFTLLMLSSFSQERENKLGSFIENCDADESRFSKNHKIGLNCHGTEKVTIK